MEAINRFCVRRWRLLILVMGLIDYDRLENHCTRTFLFYLNNNYKTNLCVRGQKNYNVKLRAESRNLSVDRRRGRTPIAVAFGPGTQMRNIVP